MSFLIDLQCSQCKERYSAEEIHGCCKCGGQLMAAYDLNGIARAVSKEDIAKRFMNMWRYSEMLPVRDLNNIFSFQEGFTPILSLSSVAREIGHTQIYLKDEGCLPGGTFKARGASVGVSMAKELGIQTIAIPTAGNAGGAWAAYGARAGMEVHVVMPRDAPEINKLESLALGAHVYLVEGLISEASKIVTDACKRNGWFSVATFQEPYRVEGKKTIGLEIAEQFQWDFPEVIICPCGGGVGIVAIWKAFSELRKMGWVAGEGPRLVAVQSNGCAPIVKSFNEGRIICEEWEDVKTAVDGLRVAKPLASKLILKTILESNGCAVAVSETEIPNAIIRLAQQEGILACPEGAATLLGMESLLTSGWITDKDRVLLLNTGTCLKYPSFIKKKPRYLKKGEHIGL